MPEGPQKNGKLRGRIWSQGNLFLRYAKKLKRKLDLITKRDLINLKTLKTGFKEGGIISGPNQVQDPTESLIH
jgi:hypothetical protein